VSQAVIPQAQPIIFFNGVILTMESENPQAQAIAIEGGKIMAVGADGSRVTVEGNSRVNNLSVIYLLQFV